MNQNEVAFIICVNNEYEFSEALYYLNRLIVPDGYQMNIITIQGAESMTSGYNAAMKSSNAKYKVYMHQDTFIINTHFIHEMLEAFSQDVQLGMLGCVGCQQLPLHARAITSWDTGKVYHNCTPHIFSGKQSTAGSVSYVEALDGLLLATQYDINWRDDLFDGWDYYDISQCFEMKRAGYKVAAFHQQQPWCYHDNTYSKLGDYQKYCAIFAKEYQDFKSFEIADTAAFTQEYEILKENIRNELKKLVTFGIKDKLRSVFELESNQGHLHLREFQILVDIDEAENQANHPTFWKGTETYNELANKIAKIKHSLKRLEYNADEDGYALRFLLEQHSIWAIEVIYRYYHIEDHSIWDRLIKNQLS